MTSPLFDVDKAFKALAEDADDPESYVEVLERFTKARVFCFQILRSSRTQMKTNELVDG